MILNNLKWALLFKWTDYCKIGDQYKKRLKKIEFFSRKIPTFDISKESILLDGKIEKKC